MARENKTICVWGEGRTELWTRGGRVDIPADYDFLPSGDRALTRAVARIAARERLYVVMRKDYKSYPSRRIGLWAPAGIITEQKARLDALRTRNHRQELQKNRQTRHEREIQKLCAEIMHRFPACPPDEALLVARHTCQVGSGRVGTSTTAQDPVRAAVIAYIRHTHTDYDDLLEELCADGTGADNLVARAAARDATWHKVSEILQAWRKSSTSSIGAQQSTV